MFSDELKNPFANNPWMQKREEPHMMMTREHRMHELRETPEEEMAEHQYMASKQEKSSEQVEYLRRRIADLEIGAENKRFDEGVPKEIARDWHESRRERIADLKKDLEVAEHDAKRKYDPVTGDVEEYEDDDKYPDKSDSPHGKNFSKKYYYTPTYVASDIPLIAGDAVGTTGAAAVPLIPVAVPLVLAYGGATVVKKRYDEKKKQGKGFFE
jgi:hypothetical protein